MPSQPDNHLSPENKYVYSAYAPVTWLAHNDNTVPYREFEPSQDGKTIAAGAASAFAMSILAKLAATHSHQGPNLSTSVAILEHTVNLTLKNQPGKGYSSTDPNYEFNGNLPLQNVARLETIAVDETTAKGFDSDIIRGMNKQLKEGSSAVTDKHWENLQNGAIMPTQLVYITTSEPPEYVSVHGIDNGLIFYSADEAKKCAESNFPIPVVEKTLSAVDIFQPKEHSLQADLTSTSGIISTLKKVGADIALGQRTFEMEEVTAIQDRKTKAAETKEKEQNKNPFIAPAMEEKTDDTNKTDVELVETPPPSPKSRW